MKQIFYVMIGMLLMTNIASAQKKEAKLKIIGEATFDFGDIKEADGPVTHVFEVKNDGELPLVITRVTASCGCTTPDWTKEPIKPKKKGEIKVVYDPTGRPHNFTKQISVYSNGNEGTFLLTIKGNVIPKQQ